MKQKLFTLLLSALLLITGLAPSTVAAEAGGSITLSGNKAIVAPGGTFVVAIYMNGGGTPIYGVESDISYPANLLQYVGFSSSGTAFEISAVNGGGDGLTTIARGTTSPVSGSGLVGTATFRALASSGSATVSIGGNSSLAKGDGTPLPFSPGSESIKFGAAAISSAGSSSSSSAAPAAPAAAQAPPKDTTPPTISKIAVKSRTPYSAVVTWITDEASDSAVDYGVDAQYGLTMSQTGSTTTHEVTLSSAFLTPKLLIHYRVKSADGAGNVQIGSDQSLQLPGIPVIVIVRGEDGKPQPGALVTLDNQTATTDQRGQAQLSSSLGAKQVVISYGGVSVRRPLTVTKSARTLPPYQLNLAKQPLNHWMLSSIGLLVLVLTLLGIDAALFGSTFMLRLVRWRAWAARPRVIPASVPVTPVPALVTHPNPEPVPVTALSTLVETAPPAPAAAIQHASPAPLSELRTTPTVAPVTLETTAIDSAKIDALDVEPIIKAPSAPIIEDFVSAAAKPPTQITISHDEFAAPSPSAAVAKRLKPRAKVTKPKVAKVKKS